MKKSIKIYILVFSLIMVVITYIATIIALCGFENTSELFNIKNLIILAIVLVLFLTEVIPIDSKWSDVFTLLALMISLPEEWYLNKIGKYIAKGKR